MGHLTHCLRSGANVSVARRAIQLYKLARHPAIIQAPRRLFKSPRVVCERERNGVRASDIEKQYLREGIHIHRWEPCSLRVRMSKLLWRGVRLLTHSATSHLRCG